jgi:hypothetical protein
LRGTPALKLVLASGGNTYRGLVQGLLSVESQDVV